MAVEAADIRYRLRKYTTLDIPDSALTNHYIPLATAYVNSFIPDGTTLSTTQTTLVDGAIVCYVCVMVTTEETELLIRTGPIDPKYKTTALIENSQEKWTQEMVGYLNAAGFDILNYGGGGILDTDYTHNGKVTLPGIGVIT